MKEIENLTFWEHLDELKKVLFRIAVFVITVACLAFLCKKCLFKIVLAPGRDDFVLYRGLRFIAEKSGYSSLAPEHFHVQLINTNLPSQFLIHMNVAIYAAAVLSAPYILYQLFRFVSPALYTKERYYAVHVVGASYLLFMMGVLLNYFLIFPLTFRFLATYQVDNSVINIITLSSYIDTLGLLTLMIGIIFEIPILSWLFAKLGFLTSKFMTSYRRHAIIVILIIAAIITPTSDVFTLMMVSLPMWLLYEFSIIIVRRTEKQAPI